MKTKITSNILEDISRKLKGESYSEDVGQNVLIVFNGSNNNLDKRIDYLKALKKNGMRVSLAFSFMAGQLLDREKIIKALDPISISNEEDVFNLKEITNNYSLIIGPNITMNTLSKVALGMIDGFIPTLIWTFLYQGKKTHLDFSSVRNYLGEQTKNSSISNMAENYIKQVLAMGVVEISQDDYPKIIKVEAIKPSNKIVKNTGQKRVITENDIISMGKDKDLILPKGSIITSLARDKAKAMNIKIKIK